MLWYRRRVVVRCKSGGDHTPGWAGIPFSVLQEAGAGRRSRSVSELVNDAIREELAEDADDLAAFDARKHEPTVPFEDFVRELKRDGKI